MAKLFKRDTDPLDDPKLSGPTFSVRFIVAVILMVGGIAWIAYYYSQVRSLTGDPGNPQWMFDLGDWNYAIGFGAIIIGLGTSAHPTTPLGRGRGVVAGMLGCLLVGLLWICTFYAFSNNLSDIWVFNDLNQWNLVVGIGFMATSFSFAMRWE